MGKWYEVKVISVKVVAVEVEDDQDADDAPMYAIDGAPFFQEAKTSAVSDEHLEATLRHADLVLRLDA